MTTGDFGVYVEGAEETIEMYEKGQIDSKQLYDAILDLDVVYKSTEAGKSVES